PRRLRELADAHELVRVERAAPMDQVVADPGPRETGVAVADVVAHAGRAGRKDREVRPPLALELELRALERLADLVVADARRGRPRGRVGDVLLAVGLQRFRGRRVVAVAVDDHGIPLSRSPAWCRALRRARARGAAPWLLRASWLRVAGPRRPSGGGTPL